MAGRKKSTVAQRFWEKVDKSPGQGPQGECWTWKASPARHGYGQFRIGKRMVKAHRYSFELATDTSAEGFNVRHSCDNPACVNPAHLSLGTQLENVQDMLDKGRHAGQKVTQCPQGHPYTEDNVLYRPGKGRECRTCKRLANQARKKRLRNPNQ